MAGFEPRSSVVQADAMTARAVGENREDISLNSWPLRKLRIKNKSLNYEFFVREKF
jgi:hypothetical protein